MFFARLNVTLLLGEQDSPFVDSGAKGYGGVA